MPRMIDANCLTCSYQERDKFYMTVPDVLTHKTDSGEEHVMEQLYLFSNRQDTVWHNSEAVVVFKKIGQEGRDAYSFPARASKPTPDGYERLVLRSDREVARVEQAAGVRHERRWYNSGNGPEEEVAHRQRSMR